MKPILIKHASIYVGDKSGTLLRDQDIRISNGKILEIGSDLASNIGEQIIDVTGKFITPGLINMHVHLPGSGTNFKSNKNAKKAAKLVENHKVFHWIGRKICKKASWLELQSGVTTLRSVGGIGYFDDAVKKYEQKHVDKSARIFASNYAITVPGGHMIGTVSKSVERPLEAIAMVDDLYRHGSDLIKVMITGGILDSEVKGEIGALKMAPAFVRPVVARAHQLGLPVAAHVESPSGLKVALEAGVDTIEHGCFLSDENIALFKQNGSSLICTLTPSFPIGFFHLPKMSEIAEYNSRYLTKALIEGTRTALKNNIKVGLGNDVGCPYVTHFGFWRELEYFHRFINVSREFALYSATLGNAEILKQDAYLGSIEPGKYADLVILDKDPMDSFIAFDNPYMVIKQGYIVKKKPIKKIDTIEESMNTIFVMDMDKLLEDITVDFIK